LVTFKYSREDFALIKTSRTNRLTFIALAFVGVIFLIWLRLHQPPNTVDDAYITFRYARNVAGGVGFVYNAGERVLGTTTPAFTLLLAALSRLSGFDDYPRLALILNALCDAVSFFLLMRLVTRLTGLRWVGLGAALLFAIDGRTLDFSTGGMESSFNVMAIILTFTLFFEGRAWLTALAAGLVVLIRPDGLTLAAALFAGWGLDALRHRESWRRRVSAMPWKEAALFAAVVAPWLIFATLYFGQPIPESVLAKSVSYHVPSLMAFRAFLVQLRTVFPFSLPPLQDSQGLGRQLLQALLPTALCVLGLTVLQRRHAHAWVIGLYVALFIAFFSVGNPLWLGWYEVPLMPLYWTLILAAVVWIGERVADFGLRASTHYAARNTLVVIALVVMAIPHLSRLNVIPWETPQNKPLVLNATYNKQREADYELLARMLWPAAHSGRLAAIPEIGAFGYIYPGKVFDTTGLISPAMLKYFPIPADVPIEIYSVPRQAIFDLRPDLFITFDSFIQATLPPDDPEFLALYRPTIGLTSHAAFGIQRLVAYRRNDLPVEAAIPPEAQPTSLHFGPDIATLEGYTARFWADQENNFLEILLLWRNGNAPVTRDLLVRVNLLDRSGQQVYQILDQPGETLFPSRNWTPGMMLVDRYELKRPVLDAGPYTVTVTLFDSSEDAPLPAQDDGGAALPGNTFVIPSIPVPSVP
jgi:hypothetical protein